MAIWSLVLFVVAELAVGQVVEPLLYGRSSRMADRRFYRAIVADASRHRGLLSAY
ncbi:hypothetical protein [Paraburkholderia sp. Cpub6]|uniref:hypothetical protein n=1 Tax=Paraburkholderia sp. Cpub6 TaxID=2723094 RepID=UPI00160E08AE|nr:hypothetical protein [Paraburkholderia sp. Cpub6]MBB5461550.1 hypothetical protein [Paraburkholderia sp. Cpub6]